MARRLPRRFYARPAVDLAPDLLGKFLVAERRGRRVAGRIVEVEAYVGPEDLASHAARGLTPRTRVMFGPPGHAYVYLIYGRSFLFNVVCARRGFPAAVLVRALEPAEGVRRTTDGPGKLTAALGITLADNARDLVDGPLWIEERAPAAAVAVATTPRINVDYAGDWAAEPLRFVDAGSHWLSRRLPDAPRRRGPRHPPLAAG